MSTAITFYRGDSYSKEFTITDKDSGSAIDISGYTFTLTVDSKQNPDTPSTTEIFSVAGVITDAANGKVTFTPTINNNDQTAKKYYYDVQMEDGSTKRTIIKDTYTITQDITKV